MIIAMRSGNDTTQAHDIDHPKEWPWSCKMSAISTRPFDAANYLHDESDVVAYLQAALEEGDPALLAAALGDVARARGMNHLARDTGLPWSILDKTLSGECAPNSEALFKVIRAMGYKLSLAPTV